MEQKLFLLEEAATLSSLSTEVVIFFDDITDKIEDSVELQQRLRLTPAELKAGEKIIRKIQERTSELRADLHNELVAESGGRLAAASSTTTEVGAGLAQVPAKAAEEPVPAVAKTPAASQLPLQPVAEPAQEQQWTLDQLWESAYASNPGPFEFESCLLPGPAAQQSQDTNGGGE